MVITFPDDSGRAMRPWRQLVLDLLAPAKAEDWYAVVAHTRIRYYDQMRPYVTRGALLLIIAVSLYVVPGTPGWAWWLLVPALIQTSLEIYLNRYTRNAITPQFRVIRTMTAVVNWSYDKTIVNVTGMIGVVACPTNIFLVAFAIGPAEPGWMKVAGFAATLLYLNSGLAGVFLDVAHYSRRQILPPPLPQMRTAAWLIAVVIVECIVAFSVTAGRWAPAMVPVAYLAGLIPIALGTRIREHDRLIGAAGRVAEPAVTSARRRLVHDVHDLVNKVKAVALGIRAIEEVPADIRIAADEIPPLLDSLKEMADEKEWIRKNGRISLETWSFRVVSDFGLDLTVHEDWGQIDESSYQLARQFVNTFLLNTGEAVSKAGGRCSKRAVVTATQSDGVLRIGVEDGCPLVPAAQWCTPRSTTGRLAERVREQFGGTLEQNATAQGKIIQATWPVVRPGLVLMSPTTRPSA
ncbi:MAG: hypothetical protein HOV67_04045 [Kribbellaceae bacterium]|nr:hypothetical protein [Kribbellaceae bacterium]